MTAYDSEVTFGGPGPSAEVVLVVDDDPGMRDTIVDILDSADIPAIGVGSAQAAFRALDERSVAVAVIDNRLPDTTGTELAARLRQIDPDLRAVMLTGYASLESVMAAVGQVDEYLVKPVPPDQLVRAVRIALERRALARERRDLMDQLQAANASLEASVAERTWDLDALRATSDMLAESLTLDEVLAVAVNMSMEVTDSCAAGIYVVALDEPYRLTLRRRAGDTWRLPAGLDWAIEAVEPCCLGDPPRDGLTVVLSGGGQQVGALVLADPQRASMAFLHTLASKLGLAVQNAQRFERERDTVSRLSELSRMKNDFLAAVSHELRTPLTVVIGFAETLRRRGHEIPADQQASLLDRIISQGARLSRLVDDLIDATGIETGVLGIDTRPVDLGAVVRRVVDALTDPDHPIEVDVPLALPPVVADTTRLEQVLVNLLDNARKYSDPGGAIWVTCTDAGAQVVIDVRDEGIGVPPEFVDRMFEPFAQADTGDTRTDRGVGLGLSIASGLVRGMGGSIEVTSTVGKGTTMTVRLAVSPVPVGDFRVRQRGPDDSSQTHAS